MKTNISKDFLKSKYRKEMWINAQRILRKLEKIIPIESAYLRGSFTTNKKRPADVDFIILLKIKKTMCHHTLKCVVCDRHLFLGCSEIEASKLPHHK